MRIRPAAALAALLSLGLITIASPAAAAIPDFGTTPIEDNSSADGSSIVDIRVGQNDGFDRFVIQYAGAVGSYYIQYVDGVTEDPSGAPVSVEGSAFITVSVGGIPDQPPAPQQTIDAGLPGLIQVVGAGAHFEGIVGYALGTAQAAGFRAFTLTDPSRLVVDIAHPDVVPTATNTADPTAVETTAESSTAASPAVTATEAAGESGSSNWLLFLVVGLAVFALVLGILGWRLRTTAPRRR